MTDAAPAWFATLDSEVVYEGWSRVRVDRVAMPDGSTAAREVVEHLDAVAIVPVLPDGSVLLLRQYRHALGGYVLEIPAGKLDVDGEAPDAAARRELREEIEHDAGSLRHLTTFRNSAGWCTESTHVYLATELHAAASPAGFTAVAEEADMEILRVPFRDALAMARSGELVDAKSVIGLLLAAQHLGHLDAGGGA